MHATCMATCTRVRTRVVLEHTVVPVLEYTCTYTCTCGGVAVFQYVLLNICHRYVLDTRYCNTRTGTGTRVPYRERYTSLLTIPVLQIQHCNINRMAVACYRYCTRTRVLQYPGYCNTYIQVHVHGRVPTPLLILSTGTGMP